MNLLRKAGLTLAAAVLGVATLGVTTPAHALDTQWPCGGCVKAVHATP